MRYKITLWVKSHHEHSLKKGEQPLQDQTLEDAYEHDVQDLQEYCKQEAAVIHELSTLYLIRYLHQRGDSHKEQNL